MALPTADKETIQAQIVALEGRFETLLGVGAEKRSGMDRLPTKQKTAQLFDDSGVLVSQARCGVSSEQSKLLNDGCATPSSNEFLQNLMVSSTHLANTVNIMANMMQNKGTFYNFKRRSYSF